MKDKEAKNKQEKCSESTENLHENVKKQKKLSIEEILGKEYIINGCLNLEKKDITNIHIVDIHNSCGHENSENMLHNNINRQCDREMRESFDNHQTDYNFGDNDFKENNIIIKEAGFIETTIGNCVNFVNEKNRIAHKFGNTDDLFEYKNTSEFKMCFNKCNDNVSSDVKNDFNEIIDVKKFKNGNNSYNKNKNDIFSEKETLKNLCQQPINNDMMKKKIIDIIRYNNMQYFEGSDLEIKHFFTTSDKTKLQKNNTSCSNNNLFNNRYNQKKVSKDDMDLINYLTLPNDYIKFNTIYKYNKLINTNNKSSMNMCRLSIKDDFCLDYYNLKNANDGHHGMIKTLSHDLNPCILQTNQILVCEEKGVSIDKDSKDIKNRSKVVKQDIENTNIDYNEQNNNENNIRVSYKVTVVDQNNIVSQCNNNLFYNPELNSDKEKDIYNMQRYKKNSEDKETIDKHNETNRIENNCTIKIDVENVVKDTLQLNKNEGVNDVENLVLHACDSYLQDGIKYTTCTNRSQGQKEKYNAYNLEQSKSEYKEITDRKIVKNDEKDNMENKITNNECEPNFMNKEIRDLNTNTIENYNEIGNLIPKINNHNEINIVKLESKQIINDRNNNLCCYDKYKNDNDCVINFIADNKNINSQVMIEENIASFDDAYKNMNINSRYKESISCNDSNYLENQNIKKVKLNTVARSGNKINFNVILDTKQDEIKNYANDEFSLKPETSNLKTLDNDNLVIKLTKNEIDNKINKNFEMIEHNSNHGNYLKVKNELNDLEANLFPQISLNDVSVVTYELYENQKNNYMTHCDNDNISNVDENETTLNLTDKEISLEGSSKTKYDMSAKKIIQLDFGTKKELNQIIEEYDSINNNNILCSNNLTCKTSQNSNYYLPDNLISSRNESIEINANVNEPKDLQLMCTNNKPVENIMHKNDKSDIITKDINDILEHSNENLLMDANMNENLLSILNNGTTQDLNYQNETYHYQTQDFMHTLQNERKKSIKNLSLENSIKINDDKKLTNDNNNNGSVDSFETRNNKLAYNFEDAYTENDKNNSGESFENIDRKIMNTNEDCKKKSFQTNQKNIKKSIKTKNQIPHGTFENQLNSFFPEINPNVFEYLKKKKISVPKIERKVEISKKEMLISALVDDKDVNPFYLDRHFNIEHDFLEEEHERNNKCIEKFFQKNNINLNDKLEIDDKQNDAYIKQNEINNYRKTIILKILKKRIAQKSYYEALHQIDQIIIKLYQKRTKNKKKYKNLDYPLEIDEMLIKRSKYIENYKYLIEEDNINLLDDILTDNNVNTNEFGLEFKNYFK